MTFRYINNELYRLQNEEMKSIYNKWRTRQFEKRIPVHIFGSNSEGNSVYLKPYHTLVDLGFAYKVYQEYNPHFFLDVDYIVITHHHGDHLNPSTLLRVLTNYPHIKVIVSAFMWQMITSDLYKIEYAKREPGEVAPVFHDPVYKTDESGARVPLPSKWKTSFEKYRGRIILAEDMTLTTHDKKTFLFEPLTVKHGDVVNIAIQILDESLDFNFLYASDLDNLDGARTFTDCFDQEQHVTGLHPTRQYTCVFLEANYDEQILADFYDSLDPDDPDYNAKKVRADGNTRHISEQETARYIERHLADDGLFIPLHASRTFGTLHQS